MGEIVRLNESTLKGMDFVRLAVTYACNDGDLAPSEYAVKRYGENSLPARIARAGGAETLAYQKAAVAAGTTATGNWAELLSSAESAATAFFAVVRERSLIGRLAFRRVPLRTRLIGAASGASAAWVGEGQAVPVSSAVYNESALPGRKVSALIVLTQELMRSADPAAESFIREDMVSAVVEAIDATLLDPANNGVADIKPASITNGITPIASTGDGLQDVRNLINDFEGDLETAVLVGSPQTFAALHDPVVLPGLGVRGGQALGIPAVASKAAGNTLALIDPAGIALGQGTVDIRTSQHGTIEMESEPTQDGTTPTAASQVSLWQNNAAAIMAEAVVNWETVRPSVSLISAVAQS